jgi:hypothetical protein
MKYFIHKIALSLVCFVALLSCQTNEQIIQNADQVKLWHIVKAFGRQQANLKKMNYKFLSQIDRSTHPKALDTKQQWKKLEIALQKQLIKINQAEDHIYNIIQQPDLKLSTLFTQVKPKRIEVSPLIALLKPVIEFEQLLVKQCPQALANQVNTSKSLTLFNTRNDDISWVVAYADLEEWKVGLLKKQQLMMAYQAQQIAFVPKDTFTTQYYLEALATSNTIVEGDKYEAKMFLGSTATNKARPRMTVNGRPIPIYNGKGNVSFSPTKPGTYSWQGSITFKNKGKDTTFMIKKQYKVVPK